MDAEVPDLPLTDEAARAAHGRRRADHVNILLVDDQPGKLLSYEAVLAGLGENLIRAGSAREALDCLLRTDIACLLVDVCMPEFDGFDLVSMIRQHPRFDRTAIILVSAVFMSDVDRLRGYERGAIDYVSVPIVPEILRAKVSAFADLHRKTRQLERLNEELERRVADRTRELEASTELLRAGEERLRLAVQGAGMGTWDADPRTGRAFWSETYFTILGYAPVDGGRASIEMWTSRIHPEDAERVHAALDRARQERSLFCPDHRIIRADTGEIVWLSIFGRFMYDAHGQPERFVGVLFDITARMRMQETLHDADRRKDQFLAVLAHELRNPLASVRNAVRVMHNTLLDEADFRRCRDMIDRQADQLSRLVDDLLDISRITEGKIKLRLEVVDLRAAVDEAVAACRPLIDGLGHALEQQRPEAPVWVHGDHLRLVQVVTNLLTNAAKYQDEGGHIGLSIEPADGTALVRVQDEGIGIPPEMMSRVFDLFTQVDGSSERARGGLGIGLSLVKNLVEMHGGSVAVRSEGRGRGAEFSVRLPCRAEGPTPARSGPETIAAGPLRALRILVVDDNQDAAESLALLLRHEGHDVFIGNDGKSALALAGVKQPEVVFLDIGLPGMDGYEICRRLRASGQRDAVIVAVSGYGQDDDRRRSHEAGFASHFVKPVDPTVLLRMLAGVQAREPVAPR
jgi:PAS domain S-box-containing protein